MPGWGDIFIADLTRLIISQDGGDLSNCGFLNYKAIEIGPGVCPEAVYRPCYLKLPPTFSTAPLVQPRQFRTKPTPSEMFCSCSRRDLLRVQVQIGEMGQDLEVQNTTQGVVFTPATT